ncbi:MAG TPA: sulfur oxidation c-type cytochrome SoxA [Casimicrobiaceae bacterium]|nr:sulfur oxidation c-type cytochrome SoxA [Casimicrobiaceae bacterium]
MSRPVAALALAAALASPVATAQERSLPLDVLRSGLAFSGGDVRAMQADDFANPGFLWVERGARLWAEAASGRSCASCHAAAAASMRGVAARYPAFDRASGAVVDLEARINDCRVRHQGVPALARESDDLLALTAYVATQSRGVPLAVDVDGPARASFERGRALYYVRHGQMNLSCAQCHELNWGKRLYAETLSQGQGNAYPAYRLEWQSLGSLQRRIRACFYGIRAEMPRPGAAELTDLELFLAWRAQGLPVEAPGVRR